MSLARIDHVDQAAVLKTLNLNPADPHTQALLLICERYRLDPLMKHVVLIQGRPYVTRDGYLSIAHTSGQFDGIEIVDEGETPSHWWARASVYRKDMNRPFTYRGRYPKKGSNPQYGPEMAVKTAEVMALRRAFNVTGVAAADERWDTDTDDAKAQLDAWAASQREDIAEQPEATDDGPEKLSSADAKKQLLEWAGGDKTAATAAWDAAGLSGRRTVTEAELASAYAELMPTADTEPTTGAPDPDEAA